MQSKKVLQWLVSDLAFLANLALETRHGVLGQSQRCLQGDSIVGDNSDDHKF